MAAQGQLTLQDAPGISEWMQAAAAAARSGDLTGAVQGWKDVLDTVGASDAIRVEALRHLGSAYREAGNTERAEASYQESFTLAERCGDVAGMAHAANWLAVLAVHRGHLDEADTGFDRARALAHRADDQRLIGMIEQNRAVLASIRGDVATALARYRAALDGFRASGDAQMIASVLNNIGLAAVELNQWSDAEESYREAMATARAHDFPALLNSIEMNAAALAARRAQWHVVALTGARSVETARKSRSRWREAEALRLKAIAASRSGDFDTALQDLLAASMLAAESEDRLLEAHVSCDLGEVMHALGRERDARGVLSHALDLFRRIGARPDVARTEALLAELDVAV